MPIALSALKPEANVVDARFSEAADPDRERLLQDMKSQIESLRRQLEGVPAERRKGIYDRLEKLEAEYDRLQDSIEAEMRSREKEIQTLREIIREQAVELLLAQERVKWAVWGLGGFGLLTVILGGVVYFVFQRLMGA